VTEATFRVREAVPDDISLIADQRAAMFLDMRALSPGSRPE